MRLEVAKIGLCVELGLHSNQDLDRDSAVTYLLKFLAVYVG